MQLKMSQPNLGKNLCGISHNPPWDGHGYYAEPDSEISLLLTEKVAVPEGCEYVPLVQKATKPAKVSSVL